MAKSSVTIRDVAALAGVSLGTASRALSGVESVRHDLRDRVNDAAEKLSFRPNAAARSLRRSKTATISLIFRNLEPLQDALFLRGVDSACTEANYSLLVASAGGDARLYRDLIARAYEQRVDGLILLEPSDLRDSLWNFNRAAVPVLSVDAGDESASELPLVASGMRQAIEVALSHCRKLGHSSAAAIGASLQGDSLWSTALRDACSAPGLAFTSNDRGFEASAELASIPAQVDAFLRAFPRPTAVFAGLDDIPELTREFRRRGLSYPRDLSLISLGDSAWLETNEPAIAAIRDCPEELGLASARLMIDWLAGQPPPRLTTVPSLWVARPSLGPAPPP